MIKECTCIQSFICIVRWWFEYNIFNSVVATEHLFTVGTGMNHVLTSINIERDQAAA